MDPVDRTADRLLIHGGRVVDPASGRDEVADVLIEQGRVVAVGPALGEAVGSRTEGLQILDAAGLVVAPGLVDIHVHLREPGQTHKEDVATGTAAAVRGGVTTVVCMANTTPPVDDPTIVAAILDRARAAGGASVFPVGAITRRLEGRDLSPIAALAAAGVVGLSDDGRTVADAGVLRRAMTYAKMFDLPILEHCEDPNLCAGGVAHEGEVAARLGLRGMPRSAEETIVARDLILAEETGARLHVQHVSTAGSVRLIRQAKDRGVRVTAEVTPHHITLTDDALEGYDTNFKVNPPLRAEDDVAALVEGLQDGTIDCIATDHAPHADYEKVVEFDRAPFGVVGLETLLGVVLTRLVHQAGWPLWRALNCVTSNPARVLGLDKGTLRPGSDADVVLLDPQADWRVDPATSLSKSRNTPFGGWTLRGRALATLVGGQIVWQDQSVPIRSPSRVGTRA
ncbi:MAG: dihydroorotase [Armatimonadota bacterium]|nr:dihydroorotase [Armatimonadota bacterium]MDR5697826.1 dihydroorotase [Armatimonadota bacterium]